MAAQTCSRETGTGDLKLLAAAPGSVLPTARPLALRNRSSPTQADWLLQISAHQRQSAAHGFWFVWKLETRNFRLRLCRAVLPSSRSDLSQSVESVASNLWLLHHFPALHDSDCSSNLVGSRCISPEFPIVPRGTLSRSRAGGSIRSTTSRSLCLLLWDVL